MGIQNALVVDDSKSARLFLRKMLERKGVSVEAVDSGEAAMEFLQDGHPDVIFMDHMMPGMDGLEAVKAIKELPVAGKIPILMCTSHESEEYQQEARATGAFGTLAKPATPDEIATILEQLAETGPVAQAETPVADPVEALMDDIDATAPGAGVVSVPVTAPPVASEDVAAQVRDAVSAAIGPAVETRVAAVVQQAVSGPLDSRLSDLRTQLTAEFENIGRTLAQECAHAEVDRVQVSARKQMDEQWSKVQAMVNDALRTSPQVVDETRAVIMESVGVSIRKAVERVQDDFADEVDASVRSVRTQVYVAAFGAALVGVGAAAAVFFLLGGTIG